LSLWTILGNEKKKKQLKDTCPLLIISMLNPREKQNWGENFYYPAMYNLREEYSRATVGHYKKIYIFHANKPKSLKKSQV